MCFALFTCLVWVEPLAGIAKTATGKVFLISVVITRGRHHQASFQNLFILPLTSNLSTVSAINCPLNDLTLRLLFFCWLSHGKSTDCKKLLDWPTQICVIYSFGFVYYIYFIFHSTWGTPDNWIYQCVKTNRSRNWSRYHVMKKLRSRAEAAAMFMKTKSSGAGAGAMFRKRKSSGVVAVSFLRRLRSPAKL